ncbi:unnamed protein product [Mytilus coruscus]|uniref:Uncharacterized protein n=1 Tax=Mytilus coruscus TaxID=42192 RepID=A0A6J8A6K4_MYTCO|nr:unnamed protein product [Mytilus coruscus]
MLSRSASISSSQEEELLGSPTALELEQEISESQAVHQNLLDYSEQADSLILSEDMDRQSEWSRDQLSILDENLSYYTTCADIVKRIHTGGPAESKKLPKFPPLPKRKLLSLYGEQAKKRKMMTPEELHHETTIDDIEEPDATKYINLLKDKIVIDQFPLKIKIIITSEFKTPIAFDRIESHYSNPAKVVLTQNNLSKFYDDLIDKFKAWVDQFQERGSGFDFNGIKNCTSKTI